MVCPPFPQYLSDGLSIAHAEQTDVRIGWSEKNGWTTEGGYHE